MIGFCIPELVVAQVAYASGSVKERGCEAINARRILVELVGIEPAAS